MPEQPAVSAQNFEGEIGAKRREGGPDGDFAIAGITHRVTVDRDPGPRVAPHRGHDGAVFRADIGKRCIDVILRFELPCQMFQSLARGAPHRDVLADDLARSIAAVPRVLDEVRARSICNMRGVSLTAEAVDAYSPQRVLNCAGVSMANS